MEYSNIDENINICVNWRSTDVLYTVVPRPA